MSHLKTTFISLFAGPGAGKSTTAAAVFSRLKTLGYDAELVPEFAKELVWEERQRTLANQSYVTARQFYSIKRLEGQCQFVITDSPVFLGTAYVTADYPQSYLDTVKWWHDQTFTEGYGFFLDRGGRKFSDNGRVHSHLESRMLDERIITMMRDSGIRATTLRQSEAVEIIVKKVCTDHPL